MKTQQIFKFLVIDDFAFIFNNPFVSYRAFLRPFTNFHALFIHAHIHTELFTCDKHLS